MECLFLSNHLESHLRTYRLCIPMYIYLIPLVYFRRRLDLPPAGTTGGPCPGAGAGSPESDAAPALRFGDLVALGCTGTATFAALKSASSSSRGVQS